METLFGVPMDAIMIWMLGVSILVILVVGFMAWRKPILTRLALRNIPRRRSQTALIVLGLMLATLLITAAFGTGDTMTYSMREAFTASLGGTDITVQRINPVVAVNGPPDFNRPVPTFDAEFLNELKAKVGSDDRIDGWSADMQQIGPIVDTTSKQGSGQTFLIGITPDIRNTLGEIPTLGGQPFDVATLQADDIVIDKTAADKLNAQVGHSIDVVIAGEPTTLKVREIVQSFGVTSQFPVVFMRLDRLQGIFNAPGKVTEITISLKGGDLDGVNYSKEVTEKLRGLVDTKVYEVQESKKDALDTANFIGSLFTTIFALAAVFSIAAGVLLIFLIFTMLAAERKSEMGMARAVGTQRGHLTQMFIFEGLAYDLAAAAVGAALGVAVAFAMVGVISGLLGTFGFRLIPHVEARSIIVAYCLGMLVTFLTIAISAARVSNLNIVAAIRDIPDMPKPDKGLVDQVIEPFNQLGAMQPMGCVGAVFALIASLFKSGPITGSLGLLMFAAGWALKNGVLFGMGASLTIIAVGLTLRWVLGRLGMRLGRRDRIAFTVAGLGLLIYWLLPIDALHTWIGAPEFGEGSITDLLFVGGLFLVLGAVWVVMYNSDILLGALSAVLGRVGRLRPVLKTAVAYPMASIFRTGLAIAMFGLIMFVLILISVLVGLNSQVDPNKPEVSGGFDIQASASFANPIADINTPIEANPNLNGKFEVVSGQTLFPLQMRQPGATKLNPPPSEEQLETNPALAEGWNYYNARFVDDAFLESNGFTMIIKAKGYATERDVWEAVKRDPNLVVVDDFPVVIGEAIDQSGGASFGPASFYISGVKVGNPVMDPVEIELRAPGVPNAPTKKVKVIGVLSPFARYSLGLYVNRELAADVLPVQLPATTYLFRARPGEDLQALRRELGSTFLNNGLEPAVISDQIRQQQAVGNGLNGLLQGFLALGLLVGVAALGVISTRAVVERRQQIGVLRAIGYQRNMVAASFLLESSFIALLGIFIGVALGLAAAYRTVEYIRQDTPQLAFSIPWPEIAGIVAVAYVVSLITTIVPSRQASKIYPAEALRHE